MTALVQKQKGWLLHEALHVVFQNWDRKFFVGRGARGTGQGGYDFKIWNCSFLPKWDTFFCQKTHQNGRGGIEGGQGGGQVSLKRGGGNSTIQCCFFLSKYGTSRGKYFLVWGVQEIVCTEFVAFAWKSSHQVVQKIVFVLEWGFVWESRGTSSGPFFWRDRGVINPYIYS